MLVKMTARLGLAIAVFSLIGLFIFPMHAQLTEATLKGVVTDTAGRSIANSPVNAKSNGTGQSRSAITDANGAFVIPALPPGAYTVSVGAPGFKSFEQKGLQLNVGQTTDLDVQLQVGEVQEVIEVKADDARVAVATDADYARLCTELGDQGALDVLLQTCMFSGFNRFTDGLLLPSEDAAIQVYRKVYGSEWK